MIIFIQPQNANHNGTLNKVPHINPFKKAIGTSMINIPLNKVAFLSLSPCSLFWIPFTLMKTKKED